MRLHALLLGLLRDGEQGLLEGQSRAHQGRQLAGEQREVGRRDPPQQAEGALAPGLFLRDFRHHDRQQLLLAQLLADLTRGIALEDALALLAGRVKGGVFEGTHRISPRG